MPIEAIALDVFVSIGMGTIIGFLSRGQITKQLAASIIGSGVFLASSLALSEPQTVAWFVEEPIVTSVYLAWPYLVLFMPTFLTSLVVGWYRKRFHGQADERK